MALAERIAVLDAGRLVHVAAPGTLYREPATAMVARFVGRGAVVPGRVLHAGDHGRCRVALLGAEAPARCRPGHPPGPALVCLRSEDPRLTAPGPATVPAVVRRTGYQGGHTTIELEPTGAAGDARLTAVVSPEDAPPSGRPVHVAVLDGWVIPAGPA